MQSQPARSNKPYYDCAVYPSKLHSGHAQTLIRYIAYTSGLSLGVYPLTDGKRYFLAVVGDTPNEKTQFRIREALSSGQQIKLTNKILWELVECHNAETGVTVNG